MFSFVPRCHGLWGSAKYTSKPACSVTALMIGDLHAAIPGQQASHMFGELGHLARQAGHDGVHVAAVELHQGGEARRALNQGR